MNTHKPTLRPLYLTRGLPSPLLLGIKLQMLSILISSRVSACAMDLDEPFPLPLPPSLSLP